MLSCHGIIMWTVDIFSVTWALSVCYWRCKGHVIWEMGQPWTLNESCHRVRGHPLLCPQTTVLPLQALWPSLGHQMTPVVASQRAKESHPHPVVCSHLIFHRAQEARKYPQGSADAGESHKMASSWASHVASVIVNLWASKQHIAHNTMYWVYASMKFTFVRNVLEKISDRWCGHGDNTTIQKKRQNPSRRISLSGFDSIFRKVRLLIQTGKTFFLYNRRNDFGVWMTERERNLLNASVNK